MPQLTDWLKLMLAEIARKREEEERAREEDARRQSEATRDSGNAQHPETRRT